ncbi:MAG TPA: hypothetical protein PKH77_13380 [Anaerolineae bacterium]|nr:hypothetical protein [Anaerolineae bacterium]
MRGFLSLKYHADLRNRSLITTLTAILCETGCILRDVEDWGARPYPPAELKPPTFAALRNCALAQTSIPKRLHTLATS